MAKRRSYATLQSYLTPPFLESSVRGIYRELMEKIKIYNNAAKENKEQESLAIKTLTVKMGSHLDLGLDLSLIHIYMCIRDRVSFVQHGRSSRNRYFITMFQTRNNSSCHSSSINLHQTAVEYV